MDETYWQQFMTTGKIEDYLQFKAGSKTQEGNRGIGKERNKENSYEEESYKSSIPVAK